VKTAILVIEVVPFNRVLGGRFRALPERNMCSHDGDSPPRPNRKGAITTTVKAPIAESAGPKKEMRTSAYEVWRFLARMEDGKASERPRSVEEERLSF